MIHWSTPPPWATSSFLNIFSDREWYLFLRCAIFCPAFWFDLQSSLAQSSRAHYPMIWWRSRPLDRLWVVYLNYITWDTLCFPVDDVVWETTRTGYELDDLACPKAGGERTLFYKASYSLYSSLEAWRYSRYYSRLTLIGYNDLHTCDKVTLPYAYDSLCENIFQLTWLQPEDR